MIALIRKCLIGLLIGLVPELILPEYFLVKRSFLNLPKKHLKKQNEFTQIIITNLVFLVNGLDFHTY